MTDAPPILLVDDEMSFLRYARKALEERGWRCASAVRPEEALRFLEANRCDVVVSDIVMPGNEELRFLRALADRPEAHELILVTGHPTLDTCLAALDLDVAEYLIKPVALDDLCTAVERAVARVQEQIALHQTLRNLEEALETMQGALERVALGVESLREGTSTGAPAAAWTPRAALHADLTRRERDVLDELMAGYRVPTVARHLGISQHTVRNHLKRVFSKLQVSSQAELVETIRAGRKRRPAHPPR